MIKEYCENCGEEIIGEPKASSIKEVTKYYEDIEADVEVEIYFCNKTCKKEFLQEVKPYD